MTVDTPSTPAAWYLDAAPAPVSAWSVRLQWFRSAVDDVLVLAGALVIASDEFPLRRLAPLVAMAASIAAPSPSSSCRFHPNHRSLKRRGFPTAGLATPGLTGRHFIAFRRSPQRRLPKQPGPEAQ